MTGQSIDIVDRLHFDAVRCEVQYSKGVAGNIEEGAAEIERLRADLRSVFETAQAIDGDAAHVKLPRELVGRLRATHEQ